MRKGLLLALVSTLSFTGVSYGAVILELKGSAGDEHSVSISNDAGQQFNVDVVLGITSQESVGGVSFYAQSMDTNTGFRLTGRTLRHAVLSFPVTDDSELTNNAYNLLSPRNLKDIGLGSTSSGKDSTSISATLMTLTFTYQGGLPDGDYRLGIAQNALWSDPNYNEAAFSSLGDAFTVHVPEPISALLLAVGGLGVLRRRQGC